MADKAVSELVKATQVNPSDKFVLEQDGVAKQLEGQILENWLLAMADGHGGIHAIENVKSSGLTDTYRITLADQTTFDFTVTNGRSIRSVAKTGTQGLVDTYTITYNDGTTGTYTVTNGAKGDTGQAWYVHIKYASQQPTAASHDMGDLPDNWIGVYSGTLEAAPADWQKYQWFQIKGEKGNTGAPALLMESTVEYQVGTSATIPPSGVWLPSVPTVPQGNYLWTRTTVQFNSGDAVTWYTKSREGIDGLGSVSSVNGVSPDAGGNVTIETDITEAEYESLIAMLPE